MEVERPGKVDLAGLNLGYELGQLEHGVVEAVLLPPGAEVDVLLGLAEKLDAYVLDEPVEQEDLLELARPKNRPAVLGKGEHLAKAHEVGQPVRLEFPRRVDGEVVSEDVPVGVRGAIRRREQVLDVADVVHTLEPGAHERSEQQRHDDEVARVVGDYLAQLAEPFAQASVQKV